MDVDFHQSAPPGGRSQSHHAQCESTSYQPEVAVGTCHLAFSLCPPGTDYGSVPHVDTLLVKTTVAAGCWRWRRRRAENERPALSQVVMASLSSVTGTHALKEKFQNRYGWLEDNRPGSIGEMNQLYRNGVPFAVEVLDPPVRAGRRWRGIWGARAGHVDQAALTLSRGVRWDIQLVLPAQTAPAGRFVPTALPRVKDLPNWNNVVPRVGVRTT